MDMSSPGGWSVQGDHPFAGEGLGEAVAVAFGGDEVGVVEQPVDRRGGEGLGHDRIESAGVNIASHGD
jgi:hypothetical protein